MLLIISVIGSFPLVGARTIELVTETLYSGGCMQGACIFA